MNDPFARYNTPPPTVSNDNVYDNPLLPRTGTPITNDDFVDSTERIINATNNNDVRFDDDYNVWRVDPSTFYGDSGLSGIDASPDTKRVFDLGKFNKVFERNKEIAKESQRLNDLNKLDALSEEEKKVSLYNLTISQIIINTKNAWFNLLDDILDYQLNLNTLTKEDRLFYIGITIVTISIILYLYLIFTTTNTDDNNNSQSTTKL